MGWLARSRPVNALGKVRRTPNPPFVESTIVTLPPRPPRKEPLFPPAPPDPPAPLETFVPAPAAPVVPSAPPEPPPSEPMGAPKPSDPPLADAPLFWMAPGAVMVQVPKTNTRKPPVFRVPVAVTVKFDKYTSRPRTTGLETVRLLSLPSPKTGGASLP